jgi:hypothetical protein
MMRRFSTVVLGGVLFLAAWSGWTEPARSQFNTPLSRYSYYPYYYFPHNYWPSMGPKWPDPRSDITTPPPAYMANPPFLEPHWRYEYWKPQFYYRGSHFWLDQF